MTTDRDASAGSPARLGPAAVPAPRAEFPRPELLERVLDGLRGLPAGAAPPMAVSPPMTPSPPAAPAVPPAHTTPLPESAALPTDEPAAPADRDRLLPLPRRRS